MNPRLFLIFRDDVDDAGNGMSAVKRGAGAAHDLDALDVVKRNGIPVDAAVKGVVELLPVVHDEDVRAAEPAQSQAVLHVRRRGDVDARLSFQRLAQTEDMTLFQVFRRDDSDVGGNFVDRLSDSCRRDGRLAEIMPPPQWTKILQKLP